MSVIRLMSGLFLIFAIAACSGQTTRSADQPVTLGAGVGTMGIYIEPTLKTGPKSSFRMPIGFGSREFSTEVDGIDYDVSGSIGGAGIFADYYPAAGSFRVSGGVFKTNLQVKGRATGAVEVGSNSYTGVDLTTEAAPSNGIAPVVSFGFDGHFGSGWGLSTDIGVMYVNGWSTSGSDAAGIVAQSDIDAEIDAVDQSLNDVNVLPFVKFGATYRW